MANTIRMEKNVSDVVQLTQQLLTAVNQGGIGAIPMWEDNVEKLTRSKKIIVRVRNGVVRMTKPPCRAKGNYTYLADAIVQNATMLLQGINVIETNINKADKYAIYDAIVSMSNRGQISDIVGRSLKEIYDVRGLRES